ncbi:unnamed protein product [Coccothraustes coccothraustes]
MKQLGNLRAGLDTSSNEPVIIRGPLLLKLGPAHLTLNNEYNRAVAFSEDAPEQCLALPGGNVRVLAGNSGAAARAGNQSAPAARAQCCAPTHRHCLGASRPERKGSLLTLRVGPEQRPLEPP